MLDTMSECFSNCKGASKIALGLIPKDFVFWLRVCIMILVYSFSIILRVILELIFKTPLQSSSKRLSLLTGIPSGNTQLRISRMLQMLWRILSPSTTQVYIYISLVSTFSPSCQFTNRSSKHKMIEIMYNTTLILIWFFPHWKFLSFIPW